MSDRNLGWIVVLALLIAAVFVATVLGQRMSVADAVPIWTHDVALNHDNVGVRGGDPVYDRSLRQVGYVSFASDTDCEVTMTAHLESPEYTFHRTSGSLAEASAMLLPPDKLREVVQLLRQWGDAHGRDVANAMVPIVQDAISRSLPLIQSSIADSIRRHESDVNVIADDLRQRVVQRKIVPLAQDRLLPIVRRHAEQPARNIGLQLWDRASLWRFAWRAMLDKTGLPEDDLVNQEWNRFVEDEVVPVLRENAEIITDAIAAIVVDTAADEQIRLGLSEAAREVVSDERTRQLVTAVLRESIIENVQLRQLWSTAMTSPAATLAIDQAGRSIEPMARQIGDTILGTAAGGISPGLTRVLRNQVLGRDRRWVVVTDNATSPPELPARLRRSRDNAILPPVRMLVTDL